MSLLLYNLDNDNMRLFITILILISACISALGQKSIALVVDSLSQDTLNHNSMYMVGMIYERGGRHSRALPFFEKADKMAPSDSAKFRLAYNLYHSGYYKRCIEISKDIVSRDSVSVEKLTLLSAGYEKIMARDSAAQVQMKIMTLEPDNSASLISMCKNLIALDEQIPKEERIDTALYYLRAYREIDTLNLFVNELYGRKLFFKKEFVQSLAEYKKLKAIGDERTNINYYMAQNYAYLDSLDQACEAYERLLEQVKNSGPNILMKYGMLCANNNREEKAIQLIKAAWMQSEISLEVKTLIVKTLGRCYYNTFDYEQAKEMFKMWHELDEESYEPLQLLANLAYAEKQEKEEKLWIEKLLAIISDPEYKGGGKIRKEWYEKRLRTIKEEDFMKGEMVK